MLAYEIFFIIVICDGIEGLNVSFGGGLGDLGIVFLLVGIAFLHIILLAILAFNHLQTGYFIALMCFIAFPLMLLHLEAAKGNEENGYMTGGNMTGLYYNSQALFEQRTREAEVEEANKPKKPVFDTDFESYMYDAEHGDL